MLLDALGLPASDVPFRLYLEPLGIVIPHAQSLHQAGVLDGSILNLSCQAPQQLERRKDILGDNPAANWKALEDVAAPNEPAPSLDQNKPGYVWKKL